MKARGLGAILVVLIVVLGATGTIVLLGNMDNSSFNATGASNIAGYGIAHEVTAVFGYNDTAHKWYTAALVKTDGSGATADKIVATFTFARNATDVGIDLTLIQTGNNSQDVYSLLQQNAIFSTFALSATSTLATKTNINAGGVLFGTAVNATATSAFSDKGIALSDYNFTLLSSAVNNMNNKTVELSPLSMFASLPYAKPQYAFWTNQTGVNTNVVTPTTTITFYQNWQRTASVSLYTDVGLATFALIALGGFIAYMASPEHFDREDERAKKWYQKMNEERPVALYGSVFAFLLILIVLGVIGPISPLIGGWSGGLAFFFGAAISIWTYTAIPKRQKYSTAMIIGLAGGIAGIFLNLYVPFATVTYNMAISPDTMALIAASATVILTIGMMIMGLMDTTRYNLKERYRRVVTVASPQKSRKASGR